MDDNRSFRELISIFFIVFYLMFNGEFQISLSELQRVCVTNLFNKQKIIDIIRILFATGERRGFRTVGEECEFREIQYSEFNVNGVIALLP